GDFELELGCGHGCVDLVFGREDKGWRAGSQEQKGNLRITRRKTGGNGGFFGVGFFGGRKKYVCGDAGWRPHTLYI
ncbi:MAG: hypothetical protein MJZ63_02405, partial [Muribaculaceae bacterium]|nr:hypothetical protein [Muribaculaceae bacterium]